MKVVMIQIHQHAKFKAIPSMHSPENAQNQISKYHRMHNNHFSKDISNDKLSHGIQCQPDT